METPLLMVLAGPPGTGKTTLARGLCAATRAVYLRVDAIETAAMRSTGRTVDTLGYDVAHELALANLALGSDVLVDAVNPVPEARMAWHDTAHRANALLLVLETVVPDPVEHRRRVEGRVPDMTDQVVPPWDEVQRSDWVPWDERRDGPRVVVDMEEAPVGIETAIRACLVARTATTSDSR